MCGISGFANFNHVVNIQNYFASHLKLRHRGTDDEGFYVEIGSIAKTYRGDDTVSSFTNLPHLKSINYANILLGFHRLAIIDPSPDGHQPMQDKSGFRTIIYNGEIYNYIELRDELVNLGCEFFTKSDTEVVLHAYAQWGINAFNHFNGMWAIAIYDAYTKQLIFSRDRFGVKPLYYTIQDGTLYFGSEVKFLLPFVGTLRVNEARAVEYVVQNLVDHHSETMFEEIYQVLPGNYCIWNDRGLTQQSYYNFQVKKRNHSFDEARLELNELLTSSINLRLRSDVPIGALLSGGLDSTTIACFTKEILSHSTTPNSFDLFSAVFVEEKYSERRYIEDTVSKIGFNINWIYPEPAQFIYSLPELLYAQEFPFRSLSVFIQWEIMRKAAEKGAKVLFDGQGSDEIFGGYTAHYYALVAEYTKTLNIKLAWRHLHAVSHAREMTILRAFEGSIYALFKSSPFYDLFPTRRIPYLTHSYQLDKNWSRRKNIFDNSLLRNLFLSALPEYLRYDDRNSMAFTIETRLPFMDYRIIEWAFSIPKEYKIDGEVSKRILREVARPIIPASISTRKDKMGFISPQESWQQNELAPLMRKVFSQDLVGRFPFLNDRVCQERYQIYSRGGDQNWAWIWRISCLTWWHQFWFENRSRFDG